MAAGGRWCQCVHLCGHIPATNRPCEQAAAAIDACLRSDRCCTQHSPEHLQSPRLERAGPGVRKTWHKGARRAKNMQGGTDRMQAGPSDE